MLVIYQIILFGIFILFMDRIYELIIHAIYILLMVRIYEVIIFAIFILLMFFRHIEFPCSTIYLEIPISRVYNPVLTH